MYYTLLSNTARQPRTTWTAWLFQKWGWKRQWLAGWNSSPGVVKSQSHSYNRPIPNIPLKIWGQIYRLPCLEAGNSLVGITYEKKKLAAPFPPCHILRPSISWRLLPCLHYHTAHDALTTTTTNHAIKQMNSVPVPATAPLCMNSHLDQYIAEISESRSIPGDRKQKSTRLIPL